jgi:hypothetical protein
VNARNTLREMTVNFATPEIQSLSQALNTLQLYEPSSFSLSSTVR